MVNISLTYKVGKKPYKRVDVPENWDECTPVQRLRLAEIIHNNSDHALLSKAVVVLFDLNEFDLERIDTEIVLEELLQYAKFVSEPYKDVAQLYPKIRVGLFEYYHGPKSSIENMKAEEFHYSEEFLGLYKKHKELRYLYLFMATLYRPAIKGYDHQRDPDGDSRIPINFHELQYYADKICKHVPIRYVYLTVLWYKACVHELAKQHPRIFKNNEQAQERDEPANTSGFFQLFRMIAESGIYGSFPQVEQMLLLNLLTEFETRIDIQNKQQEEIDKAKGHATN